VDKPAWALNMPRTAVKQGKRHQVGWLERLWRRDDEPKMAAVLYDAVVTTAREPHWYLDGAVPDTLDGRFDMVAAVMAMVMMRLEAGSDGAPLAAQLTERFVEDMDAQVRQIGFGDMVVGKHIGRMISMLGGRLGAYREGITGTGDLDAALVRNLYRGEAPAEAALAHTRTALIALYARLQPIGVDALAAGRLA
jgi:cytochrome b pre-mRNA-processing protein 3